MALLLGDNGAGKSSLGRILSRLRTLLIGEADTNICFPSTSRTRWDSRSEQRIELTVRLGEDVYSYTLTVAPQADWPGSILVKQESLRLAGTLLMSFEDGSLRLFDDQGLPGPLFTGHKNRSGLSALAASPNNQKLTAFRDWFANDVWVIRPDPRALGGRTDEPVKTLDPSLRNFSTWYSTAILHDLSAAASATQALARVLPGFETLGIDKQRPQLQARFKAATKTSHPIDLEELSDGQRSLIALYMLQHLLVKERCLVLFDEPDNYVTSRELQPWLMGLVEIALTPHGPQVWFASHHPEALRQLAPEYGTRFFRPDNGPVRTEPLRGMPA